MKAQKKDADNIFAQTIIMANPKKYGIYLENLFKDEDFYYADSYVFKVGSKYQKGKFLQLIPVKTIRSISVELGKSKNIKEVQMGVEFIKLSMDKMKNEEIASDLKQIKRYVYPKIQISEEWKQLAVQIELIIKSVE